LSYERRDRGEEERGGGEVNDLCINEYVIIWHGRQYVYHRRRIWLL
jgi:hypothetical protein